MEKEEEEKEKDKLSSGTQFSKKLKYFAWVILSNFITYWVAPSNGLHKMWVVKNTCWPFG